VDSKIKGRERAQSFKEEMGGLHFSINGHRGINPLLLCI
jgi:hypothetical protein